MMRPMSDPRLLMAAGVLVAVLAGGALLLTSAGGTSSRREAQFPGAARTQSPLPVVRSRLTLEKSDQRATGTELLISLPNMRLNTLTTTGGQRSVALTCFSATGARAFNVAQAWPLMEEFGYPFPHLHVPVGRHLLDTIRRCRLTGPGIDFEGRVQGPLPLAR
jgi:hypothetical protein